MATLYLVSHLELVYTLYIQAEGQEEITENNRALS